jgi:hypothetical protein
MDDIINYGLSSLLWLGSPDLQPGHQDNLWVVPSTDTKKCKGLADGGEPASWIDLNNGRR